MGTLKADLLINNKISILRDLKFVCNLKNFDAIYTINGKNFVKKDPNGQKPDKVITAGHFLDRIVNTLITHGIREHSDIGITFLTNSSKLFPLELQDKISSSIKNIKSGF